MKAASRAFAVVCVFIGCSIAWLILGGVMMQRTHRQSATMRDHVQELWGNPQAQRAPRVVIPSPEPPEAQSPPAARKMSGAQPVQQAEPTVGVSLQPVRTRINADLALDQRLKGLTWHSLYDISFHGDWTYRYEGTSSESIEVRFAFPDQGGVYDDFELLVDGVPTTSEPQAGAVALTIDVSEGQEFRIQTRYKSRGLGTWSYLPGDGATSLKDFQLSMTTNFDAVDFPENTLSPSTHEASGNGKRLVWEFSQMISGNGIGMVMPERTQPGEMASSLAFSAPISLLFFFLVIAVLAKLRKLEIHPINYFFLAASFFSFHLLFAYTVDHLSLAAAFALASAVSVLMVVAYLRLVVSAKFAFAHAGVAQLVYLVGFSLAHFWKGYTGVTITLLSVGTLFLLMLLTGRIRWSEVLASPPPAAPNLHGYGYGGPMPQAVPPQ